MKKTFYITTPIYYPSGKFHIGSAYTTCLCDTLRRYKAMQGYDTRFLTGTDEHGQKIQEAANAVHKTPQAHVDHIATLAQALWKQLEITNDDFIRTTEKRHEDVASLLFERLLEKGDIYLGEYTGHYCVQCEAYFTPTQLKEGNLCPDCSRETEILKEETYFFRLSRYQERLLQFIDKNPDFIVPETRKNEVVQFVKSGLNDLSVSRTAFSWGIPVRSNPKHVIYVWIDALSNYISALGYASQDDHLYQKYWEHGDEIVHVVGKDILRFHAIYWPIMLMALDIPVKFQLFVHGWYLMKEGKMSKSKGNVIYPEPLVERYGLDAFRYYIVKELPYGNDGLFTPEDYVTRINTDLANDYGNLVSRTITMANKYFQGHVTRPVHTHALGSYEAELRNQIAENVEEYISFMDEFKVTNALFAISKLIARTNKLIDETTPWDLAKNPNNHDALESVLYHLLEAIRIATILYVPVLIHTPDKVFSMLSVENAHQELKKAVFGVKQDYDVAPQATHVFPRLDVEVEVEAIRHMMTGTAAPKCSPIKKEIAIEVFDQVDIRVGTIIKASAHKNAKKLLVLSVDTGDRIRQVVSGIAEYYIPDQLVGKRVLVVLNLIPVKLRGEISEGMILCADTEKGITLVEVHEPVENGGIVR
jgi:methionyl-tRNA synthetase